MKQCEKVTSSFVFQMTVVTCRLSFTSKSFVLPRCITPYGETKKCSSELSMVLELFHSYCWPLLDNLDLLPLHFSFGGYKRTLSARILKKIGQIDWKLNVKTGLASVLFPRSLKKHIYPAVMGFFDITGLSKEEGDASSTNLSILTQIKTLYNLQGGI